MAISRRPFVRALSRLLFKIKNNTPKGAKMIKRKIRDQSSSLVWNKSIGTASCYQLPRIGESEIGLRGESVANFWLLEQILGDVFSKRAVDFKFSFIEELITRRFVWEAGDLPFVKLYVLGFIP